MNPSITTHETPLDFVPAPDCRVLSRAASSVQAACAELLRIVEPNLPEHTQRVIQHALLSGARIAVESSVDMHGATAITVVAVDAAGQRLPVLSVATVGQPPSARPS